MEAMITPVVLTLAVGVISAVILTVASIVMAVPVDETQVKVRECLPGANCGACGYAGCDDYASALAKDPEDVPANLCIPGGASAAAGIADALGVSAGDVEEKVALIRCSGITDVTGTAMEYQGFKTCASAKDFFGGPNTCKYGCIGYGDCVEACAFGAIEICNGIAKVNREKCVGCGACSKVCPKNIIEMIPKALRVSVGCKSQDLGKVTNQICKAGCIGCKICEKQCKFDAIHVVDNVAVIDKDKCKNCGLCAKNCPKKVIHVVPRPGQKPVVQVEAPAETQPTA